MIRIRSRFSTTMALVTASVVIGEATHLTAAPQVIEEQLLADAGLNDGSAPLLSFTTNNTFDRWLEENATLVVGVQAGPISPYEGDGMLAIEEASLSASQVRQRVEIPTSAYGDVDSGIVWARASAQTNGPLGGISGGVVITAYDSGQSPLGNASNPSVLDGDPATWETAKASLQLPVGTRYVQFQFSYSNASFPTDGVLYADAAKLSLFIPHTNDECPGASTVTLGSNPVDLSLATSGTGLPLDPLVCDFGFVPDHQIYNDCWFLFTPGATQSYSIAMGNGGNPPFDSRVAIYDQSNCPDDPNLVIACDDDSGPQLEAKINSVLLTVGTSYLIRVGTSSPDICVHQGELTIGTACPPQGHSNDDCVNATTVTVGTTPYDPRQATTSGELPIKPFCDPGPFGIGAFYYDCWFTFTPSISKNYRIASENNGNTTFDSMLAVYSVASCPTDPVAVIECDDDSGPALEAEICSVALTAGTTYLIRVGAFASYNVVQPAALVIGDSCDAVVYPSDHCSNAEFASLGFNDLDVRPASGDGSDPLDPMDCDFGPFAEYDIYSDLWILFTPPITQPYDIAIVNNGHASFDSRLAVYSQSSCPADPSTVIACDDNSGPGLEAMATGVLMNAGTTYMIRVGTAGPKVAAEPAALSITATSAPMQFENLCNGNGGDQTGCTDCPCFNNASISTIGGCINSAGTSTLLGATGSTSVSLPSGATNDLRFTITGAPPNALCVLLSGAAIAPQSMSNPCFGLNSGVQASDRDGLRCIVQDLVRHGNRTADDVGHIKDSFGPSRVWGGEAQPSAGIAGQAGFAAGQTRFFQVTHRDDPSAVCMRGLNTSQAVRVLFVN